MKNTNEGKFFMFFKFYKWYQIAQRITYGAIWRGLRYDLPNAS